MKKQMMDANEHSCPECGAYVTVAETPCDAHAAVNTTYEFTIKRKTGTQIVRGGFTSAAEAEHAALMTVSCPGDIITIDQE